MFHKKTDNSFTNNHMKVSNFYGLKELLNQTLVFHVEGALLKTSSLFPYFMLVAFEAGGPLRALILLLLYPLIHLAGEEELGLKIMVFLSFFGIKEKSFKIGKTVLPKFFLEDVGYEGFMMVMRGGKRVGVTDLPRVMVDGFLTDFLGINKIVGRELKVAGGYFLGLMEETKANNLNLNEILGNNNKKAGSDHVIGLGCSNNSLDKLLFSICKEVYLVTEAEKKNWQTLPREKYPKPLVFHDGRLAFRPTPFETLATFIWIPFGAFLCIFRFIIAKLLPLKLSLPILSFTGMRSEVKKPNSFTTVPTKAEDKRGKLYVCNHKTVLDPIYVSLAIMKPTNTITYSKIGLTELLFPVRTVRLTRDKEKDSKMLEQVLSRGEDIVVFPEGTTCSEPYLLSFSPLFAELSDDQVVPVAIKTEVSMFHGTTNRGSKFLDLVFFLMNPSLTYSVAILEKLPRSFRGHGGEKSKCEIANLVQSEIAMALGFESTCLSKKDKYIMLTRI
ncbi:probable glycerol-3-phosphate acyltransferase 3 [Ziziphus jujuba]|uniref:Probable glycerol-3-phosphate acyltransferase 3 n=1 Tax=Ziziphus jujuba TaxID=326968 RepID=A0A6P3ZBB4_ZIZJJ|nr:probable glycerol-3-phosphate acyltransferase 3 [Ziziphus jujuba]